MNSILDFSRLKSIPAPFNAWERKQPYHSKYGMSTSTIVSSVAKMILTAFNIKSGVLKGGVGIAKVPAGEMYVAEYKSSVADDLHIVAYNPSKGTCLACVYDLGTGSIADYKCGSNNGKDGTAILLAMLPAFLEDDEFEDNFNKLYAEFCNGFSNDDITKECMWILCDNVYRRVKDDSLSCHVRFTEPQGGFFTRLSKQAIKQGTYEPSAIVLGGFEVLATKSGLSSTSKKGSDIDHKDFVGKYKPSARVLTPKELSMVPTIENYVVITEEAVDICQCVQGSTDKNVRMRNFLLRGGAGSGKTFTARQVASGLNLPYVKLTCNPDLALDEIIGQLLPVTNETCEGDGEVLESMGGATSENIAKLLNLPNCDTLEFEPDKAYKQMTGVDKDDATTTECIVVYTQLILEKMRELCSVDNGGYRFVEGVLLQAIKYGWVCELQEPTIVTRPGVLTGLNGLLEINHSSITLPDGRVIIRHPDAVVVATTNVSYAGCRDMNESFESRMSEIYDVELPSLEVMVERAMKITGESDETLVRRMAEVILEIKNYCAEHEIPGEVGMRELFFWITKYQIKGDPYKAALTTVISRIKDTDDRVAVQSACLDPKIAPTGPIF